MAEFVDFLSSLNDCKQQAIFWHNQTTDYSTHKTLDKFYSELIDLLDGLVESVSGIYGRPVGYSSSQPMDYESLEQVIQYFRDLYDYIQTERNSQYQESWIQNQIDEIVSLIASTLYKLTLK